MKKVLIALAAVLALVLAVELGRISLDDRSALQRKESPEIARVAALQRLSDRSVRVDDGSVITAAPQYVLVVDGSCPGSLEALQAVLKHSSLRQQTQLIFRPQKERDHIAELETVAVECARRHGRLSEYVGDRIASFSNVSRPILPSAQRAGIMPDGFLKCMRSEEVAVLVAQHARLADSIGVFQLPVLLGKDTAWTGTALFKRLSGS